MLNRQKERENTAAVSTSFRPYAKAVAVLLTSTAAYCVAKTTGWLPWSWWRADTAVTPQSDRVETPISLVTTDVTPIQTALTQNGPLSEMVSSKSFPVLATPVFSRRAVDSPDSELVHFEEKNLPALLSQEVTTDNMPAITEQDLQSLPRRQLLTLPVAAEFQVNTYTLSEQTAPSMAALNNGNLIVSWMSDAQDGSEWGIYGQILTPRGEKLGSEFLVNTLTNRSQANPYVASLSNGNFIVVWDDISNNFVEPAAQIFTAAGVKMGTSFFINSYSASQQGHATVAALADGAFAVTWYQILPDLSGRGDVHGQLFTAAGAPSGAEFLSTSPYKLLPSATTLANGNFVITWGSHAQDGSNWGVYAQIFLPSGAPLASEFLVNTYTADYQYAPVIAQLTGGGFVIVWESDLQDGDSYGVYGQVFTAAGAKSGPEFLANTYTQGSQNDPAVSGLTNGHFVVAWTSYLQDGDGLGVYAQVFTENSTRVGRELSLSGNKASHQYYPVLSRLPDGGFAAVWMSNAQDGDKGGIFCRFFRPLMLKNNALAIDKNRTLILSNNMLDVTSGGLPSDITFRITSILNGRFELNSNPGLPITQFTKEQVSNSLIRLVHDGSPASPTILFNVTDGDETLSACALKTVFRGEEFGANTYTTNEQSHAKVAALLNGEFVVVWQSQGQDGNDYGIYGQRYNSYGFSMGNAFQVNTYTTAAQYEPAIQALSNGGFVVVWTSYLQDGSGEGVYGQRFDTTGTPVGSEFQINSYTASTQMQPSVAGLSVGGFIVTWASSLQDGSNYGVYAQRYDATGTKAGSEFRVNTVTANVQGAPAVAALSEGGFVIVWESSDGQDGEGYGIYGQRYNATGTTVGNEFQINTHTASDQLSPAVTALSSGGFVVAWQSTGQDGDAYGIYGQRYDASGVRLGSEFQVNSYTPDSQANVALAAFAEGGFVTVWKSNGQDVSGYGIYGQRYTADGIPRGAEMLVNAYTTGDQKEPAIAALSNGDFIVTWESALQDGSGLGVYARIFNSPPVLQSIVSLLNYTEQALPVVIAGSLIVADGDENLQGARVAITSNFISNEDSFLIVVNQEGITGFYNASNGVATFSGAATAANYQKILRNLTYKNSALNPSTLLRSIAIAVSDAVDDSNIITQSLKVTAVNNLPILLHNHLSIEQGQIVLLTPALLNTTDVDNSVAELQLTCSNIQQGHFSLLSNSSVAITSFTQQQINSGQVQFVHDGSANAPTYSVSVSDGQISTVAVAASIVFTPIAQTNPPSGAPISAPTFAPVASTSSPTGVPIAITGAPTGTTQTGVPTNAPVGAPTGTTQTGVPTSAPIGSPTEAQTTAPTGMPTAASTIQITFPPGEEAANKSAFSVGMIAGVAGGAAVLLSAFGIWHCRRKHLLSQKGTSAHQLVEDREEHSVELPPPPPRAGISDGSEEHLGQRMGV